MAGGRETGQRGHGHRGSGEGGRPTSVLCPADHGDRIYAGAGAGRAGRTAVSSSRLCEEPHDAGGGGPGHHARPGAAAVVCEAWTSQLGRGLAGPSDACHVRSRHPSGRAASREPIADPHLLAGPALRVAQEVARVGCGSDRRRPHGAALLAPRHGVHATAGRGRVAVYALDGCQHIDHRGEAVGPAHGRPPPEPPRGRSGAGQGGPRRHINRRRSTFDARDHRRAEAARAMAGAPHVVFHLGARVAQADAASHDLRPDLATGAGRPAQHRAAASGRRKFLDDAYPGPDRHARHRDAHTPGVENLWTGPEDNPGHRSPIGGTAAAVPGTRGVFGERIGDGLYIDIQWDRRRWPRLESRWRKPRRRCRMGLAATT